MLGCFSLERVLAAIGVQTLEFPLCKTTPGASVTALFTSSSTDNTDFSELARVWFGLFVVQAQSGKAPQYNIAHLSLSLSITTTTGNFQPVCATTIDRFYCTYPD